MANPVGEESWLAYLDEAVRNASDLEQYVNIIELHKRAVGAEPGSLRVWLAYCNLFWSLYADAEGAAPKWTAEERNIARDLFSFGAALDLWQQGYEAIKFRVNDSHLLWDRWISLEKEMFARMKTTEGIQRISVLYRDRLQVPHVTWDETSQAYSSFLSEHNKPAWEDAMAEVTSRAQGAKRLMAARDPFELKLAQAQRSGDTAQQEAIFTDYLEWEMLQSKRNNDKPEIALDLCRGLYARVLSGRFFTDEAKWYQYVVFESSSHSESQLPEQLLDVLRRAVQHCPWSGRLWGRLISCAEEAKLPFPEIEAIKHAATSGGQLVKNGMEDMIEMYVAWCGFLKRTAMAAGAGHEAIDLADVGLSAALEAVAVEGQRLYGKEFQGDPKFRLERIYIQYLTEKKGCIEDARAQWNKLASMPMHADSYDFWLRYYVWEMCQVSGQASVRSPTPNNGKVGLRVPTYATSVLARAASRRTIDWPERVLDVYQQHCNDHEQPSTIRRAFDTIHKAEKGVKKRREQEEQEKAAAYAAYYDTEKATSTGDQATDTTSTDSKRKHANMADEPGERAGGNKRLRTDTNTEHEMRDAPQDPTQTSATSRDRENTSVLVLNLPVGITQARVRQYFKDYGEIKNITALVNGNDDASALLEFNTVEEARSALLRDGKYLDQSQLTVHSGWNLTVYVANYSPAADDEYIRRLFGDCGEILSIRWPSLKVNSHRRFCYVSFKSAEDSAKAVAKDGTMLEGGKFRLLAKYSDPSQRKVREGAVAEGREVHVGNLDRAVTDDELREVFSRCGVVTRVNIPRSMAGKPKGFAFLEFQAKEEAEKAASELNNVKLRHQIIRVEVSRESKTKVSTKTTGRETASPGPSAQGDGHTQSATDSDNKFNSKPIPADVRARSIVILGLPETVNDARVEALVQPMGSIVQLVLQPSHGRAKIEFADAATAGKAELQLNGMEFAGHTLRIGSIDDLKQARAEQQEQRTPANSNGHKAGAATPKSSALQFAPTVRPLLGKQGKKRGLGSVPSKNPRSSASLPSRQPIQNNGPSKSNAEFRAMLLSKPNGTDVSPASQNGASQANGTSS